MMKYKVFLIAVLLILSSCYLFSYRAEAAEIDHFDNSVEEIKNSVDENTRDQMELLGVSDVDMTSIGSLNFNDTLSLIGEWLSESISGPFSACALLTAIILLASLLESYTFSLRYVDTKDIMNIVSSLLIITTLVTPITELIYRSLDIIKGSASTMLIYIPVMTGIMAFSGHIVSSGGYYATVMAASQVIAQLSTAFFAPLLNIFLALSVTSAISERVKLSGICELISKVIKWTLAFAMSIFTAILSIQGVAANAADSAASKAVRFTLSSFIPIVGASVSDAYKSIEGSVNLLRSGVGIFVIIAVMVSILPLVLQIILWQLSVQLAKTIAETFNVSSTVTVLSSISSVLSVLLAVIASLTSVFLISSGVLLAIGGGS